MAFNTIEEANEYEIQAKKEIAELKQQLSNQKTVIDNYKTNEEETKKEIDRLKIKNYELYEQVNQSFYDDKNKDGNTKNDNTNGNINEPTIDDILKEF